MVYTAVVCRVFVGVVFAASASGKLRGRKAFGEFAAGLGAMRVMPGGWVRPAAAAVAGTEAAVAVLLAVPAVTAAGMGLAVLLLAVFTGAIALVLRRGTQASCPCFGAAATPFGVRHLARNGVLVAVAVTGLATTGPGSVAAGGVLLAVLTGAVAASLVVRLDDVIDLFALQS
ncbi:MauE/DoxX family redox-associated membrane protein [Streptomyces sp. NBC_00203]|uniref:MauE/DoxX family redox-associated membrane protein n=1 Tax=Streptomyces sp. NBC_00203 TaxID=2975680 RepID=UPI003245FFB8